MLTISPIELAERLWRLCLLTTISSLLFCRGNRHAFFRPDPFTIIMPVPGLHVHLPLVIFGALEEAGSLGLVQLKANKRNVYIDPLRQYIRRYRKEIIRSRHQE